MPAGSFGSWKVCAFDRFDRNRHGAWFFGQAPLLFHADTTLSQLLPKHFESSTDCEPLAKVVRTCIWVKGALSVPYQVPQKTKELQVIPMTDQSHLDDLYFVNEHVFNCPFCNRGSVSYSVSWPSEFQWSNAKNCYVYYAKCRSCDKTSMHLSYTRIPVRSSPGLGKLESPCMFRFDLSEEEDKDRELDSYFFYSVPTSFFVLDQRIPVILRELITEAEGCLKSNFLTGGSACARKLIYEFASLQDATGTDYEGRLKSLKTKLPEGAKEYVDTLLAIQKITSEKVHENSHDGWDAKHLRVILATIREVLRETYVVPALRKDRRENIRRMREELGNPRKGIVQADQ